jgi:2-C-methyl-D-erythritol 4-phosphate cytidylyltransferase
MESISVIITAGGTGKRMGIDLPKQFIAIAGKPILQITLERMNEILPDAELVLALPKEHFELWKNLCSKNDFHLKHKLVAGGVERFYSVRNALRETSGSFVLVHDGVRPFFSKTCINGLIEGLHHADAVVPTMPLVESLRRGSVDESISVKRSEFFSVQTPQAFQAQVLKKAYEQDFSSHFTDDASVVEGIGTNVHMTKGNSENIKITHPVDLHIAEYLLKDLNKAKTE